MVSFSFEPWKEDVKFELCSTTYCFELRDKEHRVRVYLRQTEFNTSMTLVIDLQKGDKYMEYIKKMLGFAAPDLTLEEHQHFHHLYKVVLNLFNSGIYVNILYEWDEEGASIRTTTILQKGRVDVSVKADVGPHHIFYQARADIQAGAGDENEYSRWLRHFFTDVVRLLKLLKEYTNTQHQEKT